MSVTDCMCIKNGMQLVNREFVYTAKYRIKTNDRSMTGHQVLSGATLVGPHPFPSYYATFVLFGDSDANAFMKQPTIDQDEENGSVWIATATWSPIKGEEESDEHTSREDPLLRPVIYSREWEEIQIPVEQGWNKEELPGIERDAETLGPIENAAGQEPSTPIMKSKRIPVMIAEKNYATLAEIDAIEQTYGDTLNNATYATYAKGECWRETVLHRCNSYRLPKRWLGLRDGESRVQVSGWRRAERGSGSRPNHKRESAGCRTDQP